VGGPAAVEVKGDSMPGHWLSVGSPDAESFPKEWTDEVVCHTIRRNRDGSITVIALINVYGDNKQMWTGESVVRLRKK
jgi:hypothetical protein